MNLGLNASTVKRLFPVHFVLFPPILGNKNAGIIDIFFCVYMPKMELKLING